MCQPGVINYALLAARLRRGTKASQRTRSRVHHVRSEIYGTSYAESL